MSTDFTSRRKVSYFKTFLQDLKENSGFRPIKVYKYALSPEAQPWLDFYEFVKYSKHALSISQSIVLCL